MLASALGLRDALRHQPFRETCNTLNPLKKLCLTLHQYVIPSLFLLSVKSLQKLLLLFWYLHQNRQMRQLA